jgi:hypothetical protein
VAVFFFFYMAMGACGLWQAVSTTKPGLAIALPGAPFSAAHVSSAACFRFLRLYLCIACQRITTRSTVHGAMVLAGLLAAATVLLLWADCCRLYPRRVVPVSWYWNAAFLFWELLLKDP